MLLQGILFVLGLVGLYFGAEWLVRGASRLARSIGVSALVIGLTVVAFGTSAPELVVSVLAATSGQPDVALGNVVGSNIANVAVILGLTALVCPIGIQRQLVRREIPFMIVVSIALVVFAVDGTLSRFDGGILLAGGAGYVARTVRLSREQPPVVAAEYDELVRAEHLDVVSGSRTREVLRLLFGIVVLVAAARLLVVSAVFFARSLGISELVIGLTIVAIGTSLPELATSLSAAHRKETDIAAGNVVGSNIFNILAILGVAALVHPIAVHPAALREDVPVMVGISVLLLPLAWNRERLGRREGALLVATYVLFAVFLFSRAAPPPL